MCGWLSPTRLPRSCTCCSSFVSRRPDRCSLSLSPLLSHGMGLALHGMTGRLVCSGVISSPAKARAIPSHLLRRVGGCLPGCHREVEKGRRGWHETASSGALCALASLLIARSSTHGFQIRVSELLSISFLFLIFGFKTPCQKKLLSKSRGFWRIFFGHQRCGGTNVCFT